ncbi:MAG: hypothetical protein JST68_00375 [Bacteroidetes bacterium]|nr:hypothetical protein [Bacteroidota bacterium]
MKVKLLLIKLAIFSIPFLILIGLYIYWDPFKVVRHYDHYYTNGKPSLISLNRDYVSTETWVQQYPRYQYDSYIFGNSRSKFYEVNTWSRYIGADTSRCYHFDGSAESLFGIAGKMRYIASQNRKIKNALFVIDNSVLNKADNSGGHIFVKDPLTSGENPLAFQVDVGKDFFEFSFLRAFIDYKVSGQIKEYMTKNFLLDDRPFFYDSVTNELKLTSIEALIHKDTGAYYGPRKKYFTPRDSVQQIYPAVVKTEQLKLLKEIKEILQKDGTSYKIVISPLYDQKKLNLADLQILHELFGKENVFDFSGINTYTSSRYNYYESSHYRPFIADSIMRIVYAR